MSSPKYIKVTKTYFDIQVENIRMKKIGTELTPLHIIKFQKDLNKCTINIPTSG